MSSDIQINKPKPINVDITTIPFNRGTDVRETIAALVAGKSVLIIDFYSNGLTLLKEVNRYLRYKLPNKSFKEQREFRSEYQKISRRILIEVANQELTVKKAPSIGWFEKLYSNNEHFLLTFPQVQGLNSAWQWYENGITIPVLRNKLHPYYGTYFPTRFEHLEVFDNWLKRYKGAKKSAIDVGVGSGVLSLQMIKYGFQKVFATDTNPNAIVGLAESMGDTKLSRKIDLDLGHLFGKFEKQTELIVFNPPWLPEAHKSDNLDKAIYYDKGLFPDFFENAKKRLLPDGKLVVFFSNLAEITNATKDHPIKKELAIGGRFELEKCYTKSVKVASKNTKRDQHWRETEEVELWVLNHK